MTVILQSDSEAWTAARLGRVTASRISDIMAKTKSGPAASRGNYMAELVSERLTQTMGERFVSGPMQWGIDVEPQAIAAYEFHTNTSVVSGGFVIHPRIDNAGASPDGFVGDDGQLEAKCPNTKTHIDTLLGGKIPSAYIYQMQFQLACTGRQWCDFISFDPRMPENMRLFQRRLERDEGAIAEIEDEVSAFLWEVDATVRSLVNRYG